VIWSPSSAAVSRASVERQWTALDGRRPRARDVSRSRPAGRGSSRALIETDVPFSSIVWPVILTVPDVLISIVPELELHDADAVGKPSCDVSVTPSSPSLSESTMRWPLRDLQQRRCSDRAAADEGRRTAAARNAPAPEAAEHETGCARPPARRRRGPSSLDLGDERDAALLPRPDPHDAGPVGGRSHPRARAASA